MSTVITNTSVFTNRSFPFNEIKTSELEKRDRKYYIDYTINDIPIFFQINKVKLVSEPIFIDDDHGYIDVEIQDRIDEISKFFEELDNYNQVICYKNCEDWLGKSLEINDIEKVYKSSFKNNLLRLKIEKNAIKMYDLSKNKLDIENDLKIGDWLDIIVEIGGLKVMKSAFSTYIILRQIRKHPAPVLTKKKLVPNEYLFLDEYSSKKKPMIRDDTSLDSQTDIDILVNSRKKVAKKKTLDDDSIKSASKIEDVSEKNSHHDSNTLEYLSNIVKTLENEIENSSVASANASANVSLATKEQEQEQSRKDLILNALEKGDIVLDSVASSVGQSIKISKKKINSKKSNTKYTNEELFKDI